MEKQKMTLGPVPYQKLMQMHNHYNANKGHHLSKYYKKQETRSIWFESSADLLAFFSDFSNAANQISGLRVYLCQYDADTIPPGANPTDYLNKLTIGLVPTKYNPDNGKHEDHPDAVAHGFVVEPYDQGKICPPDICP